MLRGEVYTPRRSTPATAIIDVHPGDAMRTAEWRTAERPRERLLDLGAATLTDAELVSVLLRTGVAGKGALDVARDVLAQFGGCAGLLAASAAEIRSVHGLGPAKAAELKAMVELTRRALVEEIAAGDVLTSPTAVRNYLRLMLAALPHEAFMVLFLDSQHRLLGARWRRRRSIRGRSSRPRWRAMRRRSSSRTTTRAGWPNRRARTNC
jgi:DNA repair protein RadC